MPITLGDFFGFARDNYDVVFWATLGTLGSLLAGIRVYLEFRKLIRENQKLDLEVAKGREEARQRAKDRANEKGKDEHITQTASTTPAPEPPPSPHPTPAVIETVPTLPPTTATEEVSLLERLANEEQAGALKAKKQEASAQRLIAILLVTFLAAMYGVGGMIYRGAQTAKMRYFNELLAPSFALQQRELLGQNMMQDTATEAQVKLAVAFLSMRDIEGAIRKGDMAAARKIIESPMWQRTVPPSDPVASPTVERKD